jgi:hypothetical protein
MKEIVLTMPAGYFIDKELWKELMMTPGIKVIEKPSKIK